MSAVRPLEPTDPPSIGGHTLTGRLGQGGQGIVYLGESESGSQVAIKLFQTPLDGDPALRNGIVRELETAKQVARFCTAQVLDSGLLGDRPYIVSEYVPGPSLQQVVAEDGVVAGSALDRLAIGTATALVSLHDAGIIHCDFKPANVLLGPDGWRVIDFGISRMNTGTQTLASKVTGTPAFMAPEQLAGEPLGPAVDLFAWASTMAFAATGNPPFGNDTIPAVMNRISHFEPDLRGIEEPLAGLLGGCLAKDPTQRPSARQVLDRLVRPGDGPGLPTPGGFGPQNGFVFVPGVGLVPGDSSGATSAPGNSSVPQGLDPQLSDAQLSSAQEAGGTGHALPGGPAEPEVPAAAGAGGDSGGPATPSMPPGPAHLPATQAGSPADPGADRRTSPDLAGTLGDAGSTPDPGGPGVPGRRRSGPGGRILAGAATGIVLSAVGVGAVWLLPSSGSADGTASGGPAATTAEASSGHPAEAFKETPQAGRRRPTATPRPERPVPGATASASRPARGSARPSPVTPSSQATLRRVELGQGHFTDYCKSLGWDWVEWRDSPRPGAYCVKRAGGTMLLSARQRDEGCQWRFDDPRARHYFKGKTNYCYTYR